jgi:hypothetical protein
MPQKPKNTILGRVGARSMGMWGWGVAGSRLLATGDRGSTVSPDAVPRRTAVTASDHRHHLLRVCLRNSGGGRSAQSISLTRIPRPAKTPDLVTIVVTKTAFL